MNTSDRTDCSLCGAADLHPEDAGRCVDHLSTWDRDAVELGETVARALYYQNLS